MEDVDLRGLNPKQKNACSAFPCRIVVAVFCALMLVLGFVFFILGCLFTWAESTVYTYLQKPIDAYLEFSKYDTDSAVKSTLLLALLDYSEPVGQIGFWIGLTVMAFCSIGLYGSITRNQFVLFMFSAMMLAKILIVSVIVVAFHTNPTPVVGTFKELVQESVKSYKSVRSPDKHSLILNVLMHHLQCCGVQDGEDFAGSKNFDNTFAEGDNIIAIRYPYPCCKLKENYSKLANKCPSAFDDRNSNIKTGCWPKIETTVLTLLSRVSYMAIITTLLEFILVCIAIHTSLTLEEVRKSQN